MCQIPEELPLDIGLSEDPVIGVDHPGAENAEEHDEGDELVNGPEDVAGDVGDALLNVVIELSNHPVLAHGTLPDQVSLHSLIFLNHVKFEIRTGDKHGKEN